MTATTLICTLAAEAGQLWADISHADDASIKMRTSDGRAPADPNAASKLRRLEEFHEEASARVHRIEDFLMTLSPQSLQDVLVLSSLAAAFVQFPEDDDNKSRVRWALSEIVAFLEKHTGQTVDDLGASAFGRRYTTWQAEVEGVRNIIASHAGQADPAPSSQAA